jgi:hypothetical protein
MTPQFDWKMQEGTEVLQYFRGVMHKAQPLIGMAIRKFPATP